MHKNSTYVNVYIILKYIICDDNKNIKKEVWSCTRAEILYTIEVKVVVI